MPAHCARGTFHSATYVYKICAGFSCAEAQSAPPKTPTASSPAHGNKFVTSFFIASSLTIEIALRVSQRKFRTTNPPSALAQFMSRQISKAIVRGVLVGFRKCRVIEHQFDKRVEQ